MLNITNELKAKLLDAKSAEEVTELLKADGQEITPADAARLWEEISRQRNQDGSELSPDELEAISGGTGRDWLTDGCAATVEPGSDCWGTDYCILYPVPYENSPVKRRCGVCNYYPLYEKESIEHKCDLTQVVRPWMKVGRAVHAGEKLTEGQIAPKELLEVAGVRAVQEYILKEVKKVYSTQSIDISDKHLEVMIKQMLKKVIVIEGNDSGLSAGQTLSLTRMNEINDEVLDEGRTPAKFGPLLLGISKSAVETDSFLSAASFQETTRVLTDAAVRGKKDKLEGLKENVIIGKLIPAGTGRKFDRETSRNIEELASDLKEQREARARELEEATTTRLPEDVLSNGESRFEAVADEAPLAEETAPFAE